MLLTVSFLLTSGLLLLVLATEDAATLEHDEPLPAAGDRLRVDSGESRNISCCFLF